MAEKYVTQGFGKRETGGGRATKVVLLKKRKEETEKARKQFIRCVLQAFCRKRTKSAPA